MGYRITAGQALTKPLDDIYTAILREAMNKAEHEEDEIEDTMRVLGSILVLREQMTIFRLSDLLSLPHNQVRRSLDRLHALVSIPHSGDVNGTVSTLHASFSL